MTSKGCDVQRSVIALSLQVDQARTVIQQLYNYHFTASASGQMQCRRVASFSQPSAKESLETGVRAFTSEGSKGQTGELRRSHGLLFAALSMAVWSLEVWLKSTAKKPRDNFTPHFYGKKAFSVGCCSLTFQEANTRFDRRS